METKHTPGPWIVRMTASGNPFIYEDATGKNIAGVAGCRPGIDAEESQDNAALIAQAPDLLTERDRLRQVNAELLAALRLIVKSLTLAGAPELACQEYQLGIARAAIAKAQAE